MQASGYAKTTGSSVRHRLQYLLLALATVPLGLASRRYAPGLPAWVGAYAGDALWALLVYWLAGAGCPRWPLWPRAGLAAGFAWLIEISQLWQAPWLRALRHTPLGALVLGQGFLWSDLGCYAVGIGLGAGLEAALTAGRHRCQRP